MRYLLNTSGISRASVCRIRAERRCAVNDLPGKADDRN